MKYFHLNDLSTQVTPRANAGKVKATIISIETKILHGRDQEQASELSKHPAYKYLEKYVLANPTKKPLETTPASMSFDALMPAPAPRNPVVGKTVTRKLAKPTKK